MRIHHDVCTMNIMMKNIKGMQESDTTTYTVINRHLKNKELVKKELFFF